MKLSRGTTSGSTWLMRLGVLVLAVGVVVFAGIYYQDQHVDAGPSLVDRQIQGAEAAVKKAPNNVGVRLQLATAYRSDKRNEDAQKQYDEILKADAKNRAALLGLGSILMTNKDFTAAAVAYHKVTDIAVKGEFAGADPQLAEAHYFLGSIALTQGQTKTAINELNAALTIDRSDSDSLYLLGVARLKDGAPQLAVDALKQALRFVPTGWCEPYAQLGAAYAKLGQTPQSTYAGAMEDFCHKKPAEATTRLKTLTTGPVAVDAMLGLGLIAETGTHNAEAISWYKKAVAVDRTNISAMSALSRLGVTPAASAKTQGPK